MRGRQKEGIFMAKRRTRKEKTLQEQAEEIMRLAEESGVQTNFFFVTTFDRYLSQLAILEELKATIEDNESLVTQTYVKGRSNVVLNPAIRAFNSTTDSANKTVSTLMRIINGFESEDKSDDVDPLLKVINGGEDYDADGE
jgi:hypothetical protein